MKVLVVEDYAPLRLSLGQGLHEAGYAVDVVDNGTDGLAYAQAGDYDVIVLDIMLPGLDGVSVVRCLRQERCRSRILLLTARDSTNDRVRGLDAGADDYLVKPFAVKELLARVRALVRRRYERTAPTILIHDLEIDLARRVVSRGGKEITLTSREFCILEVLALRQGQIVTRDEIWDRISDLGAERGSNVLDVYIGYLRRKLEDGGGPRVIHTRRGLGYVLYGMP